MILKKERVQLDCVHLLLKDAAYISSLLSAVNFQFTLGMRQRLLMFEAFNKEFIQGSVLQIMHQQFLQRVAHVLYFFIYLRKKWKWLLLTSLAFIRYKLINKNFRPSVYIQSSVKICLIDNQPSPFLNLFISHQIKIARINRVVCSSKPISIET